MIPQHSTHFLQTSGNIFPLSMYYHQRFVALHVGSNGSGTHVALIAQDAVTNVVVVRGLHAIKEDHVFQLDRIAHHAVLPHQGCATNECAVPHLGSCADDAGSTQVGRRGDNGCAVYPHLGRNLRIVLRIQMASDFHNQLLNAGQCFPRIGKAGQIILCQGVIQIIQVMHGQHHRSPSF